MRYLNLLYSGFLASYLYLLMYPLVNQQAELLLPGFQDRNLQAGILNRVCLSAYYYE